MISNVERFYPFEDIEAAGSCIRYVRECLGQEVRDDRCIAIWRGGKNYTVALTDRGWFDHKTKEKGGIIKLCAMAEFGGEIQQAQQRLGDWLGLSPTTRAIRKTFDYRTQSLRYKELIERGFDEVKKYTYTDENGTPVHFVIRMEHPTEKKQFIQCTPYSGSIRDIETKLYNLPVIRASDWVVVVEGEKDADTLIEWGIPATTCNNGSDHWRDEYTEALRGKDVVICRDNDEPGNAHAHLVLRSLAGAAKSLRVICPSRQEKGDITDWKNNEGGTVKKFYKMMESAQLISSEEAMWSDEALMLYRAKKANEAPFTNYRIEEKIVKGKSQYKTIPRTINEMIEDIHTRFLGFPRRLGKSMLFDHDRDTDRIEFIQNGASLFSWIGEKSKKAVMWERGVGLATKDEFYQALMRNCICYEKISEVPNYPMRHDVYYTFRDKLKPTDGHKAFKTFMSFFNPEDRASEVLMMTMAAAMMYYRHGIQRPCWIIDSKNGQAAGKTTFAEMLCYLYKCSPIKTTKSELERDPKELNKRLVSITGRNSLMLLVDNVRGTFDNSFFADLVTGFNISGKAPYGIGEESRPNDLTYVITSNSANVGSDMASRSFPLFVKPPQKRDDKWKSSILAYTDSHRYEILGDIYDKLDKGTTPDGFIAHTRVPEFESEVMSKMVESEAEYKQVIDEMLASRSEANIDEENAVQIVEVIKARIGEFLENLNQGSHRMDIKGDIDPEHWAIFIRSHVFNFWMKKMMLNIDVQDVRNMVNVGRIECIDKKIRRFPNNPRSGLRMSGLMYYGDKINPSHISIPIIGMKTTGDNVELIAFYECSQIVFQAAHVYGDAIEAEIVPPNELPQPAENGDIAPTEANQEDPDFYEMEV